jgi:hypothetical protein
MGPTEFDEKFSISFQGSVAFAGGFLAGLGLGAAVAIFGFAPSVESIALPSLASLLAAALSPLIMGVGFDLTGSYRVALWHSLPQLSLRLCS